MTNEEIVAYQNGRRAFAATEIGKLFATYRSATQRYWQQDSSDTISERRLRELGDAEREAEDALVSKLMADYGVI